MLQSDRQPTTTNTALHDRPEGAATEEVDPELEVCEPALCSLGAVLWDSEVGRE